MPDGVRMNFVDARMILRLDYYLGDRPALDGEFDSLRPEEFSESVGRTG